MIAEHYGIRAPVPKSVIIDFVLPPDGAFWRELALELLKDKFRYFQAPARRGPRATFRSILPLIAPIIRGDPIQEANREIVNALLKGLRLDSASLPATESERLDNFAEALRIDRESLDRELRKLKPSQGENSGK